MEHYKYLHLNLDVPFVTTVALLLAISRDIGFIHYKAILTKSDKQVMNGLKSIVLDYKSRGFKVTTAFAEDIFKHMIDLMR